MEYDTLILVINTAVIVFLITLALLLGIASRFKGESGYAAMIIVITTIPNYIHNICHSLHWEEVAFLLAPLDYSVNLTLMPLLWFLAQRGFNPEYRFKFVRLLHFLPAIIFFILVSVQTHNMTLDELRRFMFHKVISHHSWLRSINFIALVTQMAVYFFIIFRYLRRVRKEICDNTSNAESLNKLWIPRLITFFGIMIFTAIVCYNIWPQTDRWLFFILNFLLIVYLIYNVLFSAMSKLDVPVLKDEPASTYPNQPDDDSCCDDAGSLRQCALQVEEYLRRNELFVTPRLTLNDVAMEMNISPRRLSNAINTTLGKTFFELVNGMRIEKSKTLLHKKREQGLTLETIAEMCGFSSQVTFCNAFKKIEGITTSQWLKQQK